MQLLLAKLYVKEHATSMLDSFIGVTHAPTLLGEFIVMGAVLEELSCQFANISVIEGPSCLVTMLFMEQKSLPWINVALRLSLSKCK